MTLPDAPDPLAPAPVTDPRAPEADAPAPVAPAPDPPVAAPRAPEPDAPDAPDAFRAGEPIEFQQLGKPAPYMTLLRAGATANVRGARFPHGELIGRPVGSAIRSPQGEVYFLVRPTLARWVESMPRFAKTIYPKEAGPILLHADVFPGARVLEAGLGSGGLTLSLLRAVGPSGQVISCDVRDASLKQGRANVAAWYGGTPPPWHVVVERDVYEGLGETGLDRIVLDLPEPWQVVPHVRGALRPGGILAAFLPSVTQVHELVNALRDSGTFPDIETLEVLQRRWLVGRRAVRPDHHMVGHTGFLTVARHVEPAPA